MVAAIIIFMGAVSGAHLNPAVTLAFAVRGDFSWKRVPAYIVAEFVGACLAALLLWGMLGKFGPAGLTLPGHGVTNLTAFLTEMVTRGRAGERDPWHRIGCSAARSNCGPRRRVLHRARWTVGCTGQRRIHESCPFAWASPRLQ